jgi:hypothetical protein
MPYVDQGDYRLKVGTVHLAPWPSFDYSAASLNAKDFTVKPKTKTYEEPDYESVSGGSAAFAERIESVELAISFSKLSRDSLAVAMAGNVTELASLPVVDAFADVTLGVLRAFSRIPSGAVQITSSANPMPVTAAHQTAHAYTIGALVTPVVSNGYYYRCSAAGSSHAVAPTWPTVVGATVTDGTAEWVCVAALPTLYLPGVDYKTMGHGGIVPLTGGQIVSGADVYAHYTAAAMARYDAMTSAGGYYRALIYGEDIITGRRVKAAVHKIWIGPGESRLAGEVDFDRQTITSRVLRDDDVPVPTEYVVQGVLRTSPYYHLLEESVNV